MVYRNNTGRLWFLFPGMTLYVYNLDVRVKSKHSERD